MRTTPVSRLALGALMLLSACAFGPEELTPPAAATATAPLSATRPTVRESVASLTAKGPETLERVARPTPGSPLSVIRHGNAEVLIAKKNPDGTVTRRCVSSVGEADAFLGGTATEKAAEQ